MNEISIERTNEGLGMLSAFVSIESTRFDVIQLDVAGEHQGYRPGRNVGAMRLLLPYLIPLSWQRCWSLVIRPRKPAYGVLAQLDDLNSDQLARVRSTAFLVVETSHGNYQAWLAIEGGSDDLVRRLVKAVGVDWNASRAVRAAGSPNCKPKYAPDFPMVRLAGVQPCRTIKPTQLEDLGLVAPPQAAPRRAPLFQGSRNRGWPDYERCLRGAPVKKDGGPDRSRADYLWCKWAVERGNLFVDIAAKLLQVSEKARQEWDRGNKDYVRRTVESAFAEKVR